MISLSEAGILFLQTFCDGCLSSAPTDGTRAVISFLSNISFTFRNLETIELLFEILNGAFSSNREIPLRFQLLVELPDDLIGLAAADAHDFSDFCCGDVLSFHKTPLPFLTAVREMCTFHTSVFVLIIEMRIKMLRKKKGLSQTELAQMLGKSLRTVQKYETGEIEVSISVINQIAEILETSSTYLFGYESGTTQIKSLSDVMDFLFKLENVARINFHIDVKKPPRSKEWSCSISFDGKSAAEFNADMCLFLEQWQQEREDVQSFASTLEAYKKWKDTTLAYYAANTVETVEPQELDPDERIRKRNEFLENAYKKTE